MKRWFGKIEVVRMSSIQNYDNAELEMHRPLAHWILKVSASCRKLWRPYSIEENRMQVCLRLLQVLLF